MKRLLTVMGVILAVLIATIAQSSAQTINGCYSNKNGVLRIVADATECTKNETFIWWNQTGPSGISRVVHGQVHPYGIIGTGFSMQELWCSGGYCYTRIIFDQPFTGIPTCIASPVQPPDYYNFFLFRLDEISPTRLGILYEEVTHLGTKSGFDFVCFE